MKLLKDERVVALNDCIVLCLDAARFYAALAEASADPDLAAALRALSERRLSAAARLSPEVRAMGELPAAPPQEERVLLETAVARLMAGLAEETDRRLREEVAKKEAQVHEAAGKLLALDLPETARSAASALRQDREDEL